MNEDPKLPVFRELLKRRIFRTLAIYIALAWATIEILITILDRLGAPEWIGTALVVLFIAGFPIVTLGAWMFDIEGGRLRRVATGRTGLLVTTLGVATVASTVAALIVVVDRDNGAASDASRTNLVRFDNVRTRPLTALEGYEFYPSISPDGRFVAYSHNDGSEGSETDIFVEEIDGGSAQRVQRPGSYDSWPAWSPDGTQIAFISNNDFVPGAGDTHTSSIVLYSIVGGTQSDAVDLGAFGVRRPAHLDWSADGRWFTLNGSISSLESTQLLLVSTLDGSLVEITPAVERSHDTDPRFSPDSARIAFIRDDFEGRRVCLYSLSSAAEQCLTPEDEVWPARRVAWLPGSKALLSPFGFVFGAGQMVQIDVETRDLSLVPFGSSADYVTIARETGRIVMEEYFSDHNIWRFPGPLGDGDEPPRRLITSTRDDIAPRYSPDGSRIAFMSTRSGSWEIWVADNEGEDVRRLTDAGFANFAAWSHDGSRLSFSSFIDQLSDQEKSIRLMETTAKIYSISTNGGIPRLEYGSEEHDAIPSWWSADGDWLHFNRGPPSQCGFQLWRKRLATGEIEHLADCLLRPEQSDSGRYYLLDAKRDIVSVRSDGSDLREELPFGSAGIGGDDKSGWTVWRDNVVYLSEPDQVIRMRDRETGDERDLVKLEQRGTNNQTPQLDVSPDGKWVLHDVLERTGSDLVLIDWTPMPE